MKPTPITLTALVLSLPVLSLPIVSLPMAAIAQQARDIPTLQQGTPVSLALDETLSTAHARVGQRVAFAVTSDVNLDNQVVIPAGSSALGTVAQVERSGWTRREGRLDLHVDMVRLPGGQIVPLSMTAGLPLAPIGVVPVSVRSSTESERPLLLRRRDVSLPEGTVLRAYVRRDTIIVQQTASMSN